MSAESQTPEPEQFPDARRTRVSRAITAEFNRMLKAAEKAKTLMSAQDVVDMQNRAVERVRERMAESELPPELRKRVRTDPGGQKPSDESKWVMIHAIRQTIWWQRLEAALYARTWLVDFESDPSERRAGPRTDHSVAIAVVTLLLLDPKVTEMKSALETVVTAGPRIRWALGIPDDYRCGTDYRSVQESISGRAVRVTDAETNAREINPDLPAPTYARGMLRSVSTQFWHDVLPLVARALAEYFGKDFSSLAAVDGTPIIARRRQGPSLNAADELEMDQGLGTAWINQGKKKWRGFNLLTLTLLKPGIPVGFVLLGHGEKPSSEHLAFPGLMQGVYDRWEDIDIEVIAGDKAYDNKVTHRLCELGFAVHPAFIFNNQFERESSRGMPTRLEANGWGLFDGVPCPTDGDGQPLRLHSTENFQTPENRRKAGLKPGEIVERLDGKAPRLRYEINGKRKDFAYLDNPRWLPFYPLVNSHAKRYLMRLAMQRQRNVAEMMNAQTKAEGLDHGLHAPKWINSRAAMEHYVGAALFRHAVRKLLRLNGGYQRSLNEAIALGYLDVDNAAAA